MHFPKFSIVCVRENVHTISSRNSFRFLCKLRYSEWRLSMCCHVNLSQYHLWYIPFYSKSFHLMCRNGNLSGWNGCELVENRWGETASQTKICILSFDVYCGEDFANPSQISIEHVKTTKIQNHEFGDLASIRFISQTSPIKHDSWIQLYNLIKLENEKRTWTFFPRRQEQKSRNELVMQEKCTLLTLLPVPSKHEIFWFDNSKDHLLFTHTQNASIKLSRTTRLAKSNEIQLLDCQSSWNFHGAYNIYGFWPF